MNVLGVRLQAAWPHLADGERRTVVTAIEALSSRRAQQRLVLALARDERALISTFATELRSIYGELGAHVGAVADKAGGLVVEAQDPTAAEESRIERILTLAALREWAGEKLRPSYEGHWLRTAKRTVETINAQIDLGVSLPDPVANRLIAEGGRRAGLADIEGDTRRALFRALSAAREEQLGPAEVGRRIRQFVPQGRYVNAGVRYRAEMVARTETKWAQNQSSLEVYEGAENVIGVRAYDNRTGFGDADCVARDGRVFDFASAQSELASEHPNFTLSFAPEVAESLAGVGGGAQSA